MSNSANSSNGGMTCHKLKILWQMKLATNFLRH
jgi:hypothetical protein